MRRRWIIFGGAVALYIVLMSVTWVMVARQAKSHAESQLDFSVLDFHNTVAGAIDTMLGHVARTAVRHVGQAERFPMETMEALARELDIDEVNVVSRDGEIIASNDPHCMGVVMADDPVMDQFMELTNGVTATVSQPFRPHARNPEVRAKYLAAAFPGGNGFVQVGLDETRLAKMLPSILGYIFDEWLIGEHGFFLCADMNDGRLISNPSRHRGDADTLRGTGYDPAAAAPYEFILDGKTSGATFTQSIFGELCDCRAFRFGEHRFVAALPRCEFQDTRNLFIAVFAVIFMTILAVFAFFLDRIFSDSDQLKAFYKAEEERLAKDLAIASTIQTSALPTPLPASHSYHLYGAMQSAREIGGDFYDYFMLDATHVAFLVADVSGKGVTAALYMMTAKTLIKDTLLAVRDPALALTKANGELCRSNSANMFLTAWVGVLDLETGIVTYANAGHNPPVVLPKVRYIQEKSGPVIAFTDGVEYKAHALKLSPGDALFLYTDGVTEALDSKGDLFGEERLADALKAAADHDAQSICTVVRAAVTAFAEGMPQSDDITVLSIRYLAPPRLFSRSFQPTQQGVADASEFLDKVMEGAPEAAAMRAPMLHIILDEICSNIVKHSGAGGFEMDVEIKDDAGSVQLTFIDDGVAYDPLTHIDPDTTLPVAERPIGGLGIMMVKKMSRSVSYQRKHNRNFLTVLT